ncbi:alpha/beta hydrolase [Corynebacterium alimapuense]|uniref:Esterase n=1 Tax=Corynebacterium alimapuense TaxID=1576874 RepID=A0A3M8K756_9CORY|nr:alpha/beta hydrolase family protein [Corynebacterium alimapuense]RNE48986.1 esterase [Corynebacterium alimapuense]
MKLLHSIAAPIAAASIAAGMLVAPTAGASELSATAINNGVELSTISQMTDAVTDSSPEWYQIASTEERIIALNAYSPSMGRDIPLAVITPDGTFGQDRPTIYLLNGAGGAEQDMDWISSGEALEAYADKDVNVVIPMQGAFSYYVDWLDQNLDTPYLQGPQMWETFLLRELPGAIEPTMSASNYRGIAGMSMSATSSLLLAGKAPGFYDAVGSYSGCAATSDFASYTMADITVNRGGASAAQMLGPVGGEYNRANDALVLSEGLRGSEIYVSNATGLAGEREMPGYYIEQGVDPVAASAGAATLIVEGGVIEAATNTCTHNLQAKLNSQGIDATFNLRPTGSHSWSYWQDDLIESWPTFARGFDM